MQTSNPSIDVISLTVDEADQNPLCQDQWGQGARMSNVIQNLWELVSARQHNRILRMAFPNNDGPECELVINKLHAVESLSREFEFTIELLSNKANLALKDMEGKLLSVALVQANGTLRYFSGFCFAFRLKKAGNVSYYEATLGPWLKYLVMGKDNYLFHDKTLREQTESIFSDYAFHADWDLRLTGDDPAMTDAMQCRESDHNYLHCRWEAAGWHYYYVHTDRGQKLVLSDDSTQADPIDGDPEIRFHRHGGSLEEEAISEWSSVRQIMPSPAGEDSIHTDQYGRIRVQFHWDRVGGNDDGSSAYIRVGTSWAGSQLGMTAIPRVGSEVVVNWLDGSPDRPYVANAIHNERYMPSWSLPTQQALTGFRTRELSPGGGGNSASGRSNHLILDDTYRQIQVQLKSDHLHSQLSLGSITRIEGNTGRTDARGEGWELATEGWGVARSAKGMLITTEARPRAASHIKDMGETVQRLTAAREQHEEQAAAARQQGAQEQQGQQADVTDAIKAQNDAIKGAGDAGSFPELAAPHFVLASPAGIENTSAQSTHIASEIHTAITTGKNFSVATGDSFFASISRTFRLFVHKAGMRLIAAAGKVTIQAQSDEIEIIAKKVLALYSEQDWVEIRGKLGVRISGGADTLEISDTSQFLTRKPVLFHGNLETLPSRSAPPPPDRLPEVLATAPKREHLHHTLQSHTGGKRHAFVPYTLYKGGAKLEDGLTDEFGRILIEHETGTAHYTVKMPNGEEIALNANAKLAAAEQSHSNIGMRALHDTPESRHHD